MLGNCENMVVISPTTNEWPQNNPLDEKSLMASTSKLLMEKQGQELTKQAAQQQHQQQPLKCPRCDSSNTKFCYYNNYSLSQPRHFCKACKRYWTRGGTLRNVPVGGGCRKNKRVKRPVVSSATAVEGSSSVTSTTNTTSSNPNSHISHQNQIDISSASSNQINHLFYGLPTNPSEINNLPFHSGRFNTTCGNYDLQQPQLSPLALGFSSSGGILSTNDAAVTSNSLLSSYSNIFGSSSTTTTTTPTMATLLASSLHHQQKFNNCGMKETRNFNNFHTGLASFEGLQMSGNSQSGGMKEVKIEPAGDNRLEWNLACQNQIEHIGFSDPSIYWNSNTSVGGAWHDPATLGSSVTPLI